MKTSSGQTHFEVTRVNKQTNDRPNRQHIKETTRRKNTNKKKKRNKNNHVITDKQTEKWKTRI